MSDPQSQVGHFISQADPVVNPPGAPRLDPNAPLVPFQTDLKLTREQEKRMIEHAFKRMAQLQAETGRDNTLSPTWWLNSSPAMNTALASQGLQPYETFMGKRARYDATFANDVSWRPYTFGPNNIFFSSNIPVPVVRRVCRQMVARAKDAFFSTDTWFSIDPAPVPDWAGDGDEERADRIERFVRFKLGDTQSDSKTSSGRAIQRALILGECVVKTSYVVRDQIFNVESTVLHSVEGEPVRAADGNFITQDDRWEDAQDGQGTQVLARDKQTVMPMAPIWQKIPLNRRQVLFEGTKSEPIYYKDFLCPLTAEGVQEADCVIHLQDHPVMWFVDLAVKRGMIDDTTDERLGAAQKMLALIKQLNTNSPLPKAAEEMQTRPNENFISGPSVETGGPVSEFAEFYLWFDADGDGIAENIMLICDKQTQAPIFYDHVANVTTDGLRPLQVVRVNPVEGRWYGVGIMELFESYQAIIDLLVNRWNFSQSRSGRVDFWRPTDTQEGDRDPNLKMNYGQTYTVKPGIDPEQVLHSVYLNDIKFSELQTMIQFFIQLLLNESGVANANDANAAGMASTELATGINEVRASGDVLFMPTLQDLRPALQAILDREVDVTLSNMNPKEVFTYLDGNTMGIDTLTPDDVRGLKFKTRIELNTQAPAQQMQMSQAATALVEKFYMLQPAVQAKVVDLYRQQLRILAPRADVNNVLDPMPDVAPPTPPPKTSVAVSLKGEDLEPEEKDQLLAEVGVHEPTGQPQETGSMEKLGSGAANTEHATQLRSKMEQKAKKSPLSQASA